MDFKRLTAQSQIDELIDFHNRNSKFLVIDLETTDKSPRRAVLVDIQISGVNEDSAVIFGAEFSQSLLRIAPQVVLVAHNYKYDAHVLFRHNVNLLSRTWRDTLLLGHLVDENRDSYSLDSYVKDYWNDSYKEEFWNKYTAYEEATQEDQLDYACRDVVYTQRLFTKFQSLCIKDKIPDSLVDHVHRLQSSLLWTEIEGVKVDLEYLQTLGVKLKRRIDELYPEMRNSVHDEIDIIEKRAWLKAMSERKSERGKLGVKRPIFSFDSSSQLQSLLYGSLGLPVQKNDKTKSISTDYASLEKLQDAHPVVGLIQENRKLQKIYTSYIQGTLERLPKDQDDRIIEPRIYPEFRIAGTVTGRISHNNPNLAQLPKKGGVRAIYVPDSGRRFISADYSQLEVVIEANLTRDKNLIRMFENGESKHDVTARELGCDRDTAKTLNFALQYWCTAGKVAKLLGVSADEGKRVYDKYWEVYSGSKRLKAETDKKVDDGISLITAFGRKRRFEIRQRTQYDGDYRQAYNFLIQGTGADITSRAFYLISEWLRYTGYGRGCWSVHDELIIEVKQDRCLEAETKMLDVMLNVGQEIGLTIPLKAESSGPMEAWLD